MDLRCCGCKVCRTFTGACCYVAASQSAVFGNKCRPGLLVTAMRPRATCVLMAEVLTSALLRSSIVSSQSLMSSAWALFVVWHALLSFVWSDQMLAIQNSERSSPANYLEGSFADVWRRFSPYLVLDMD